jgi:hypothetical protein
MRKKIKPKKIWITIIFIVIATIVFAQFAGGLAEQFTKTGTKGIDTRKNYLLVFETIINDDHKQFILAEEKFKQLSGKYIEARKYREQDAPIPQELRTQTITISNEINSIYTSGADEARNKGFKKVAQLYEFTGESIVTITEIQMQDEVCAKHLDQIRKRNKEEQQLSNEAYAEVDKVTVDPKQKDYLRQVALENLKSDLSDFQSISSDLKLVLDDLQKELKGKGFLGAIKSMGKGCGPLDIAKSLLMLIQSYIDSLTQNIKNLTKFILK